MDEEPTEYAQIWERKKLAGKRLFTGGSEEERNTFFNFFKIAKTAKNFDQHKFAEPKISTKFMHPPTVKIYSTQRGLHSSTSENAGKGENFKNFRYKLED